MALQRHAKRIKPGRGGNKELIKQPGNGRLNNRPLFRWAEAISKSEWEIYHSAIETMREAGISFLLGGGFALATFTGRWRDTKDIDFYIRPQDREKAIAALTEA